MPIYLYVSRKWKACLTVDCDDLSDKEHNMWNRNNFSQRRMGRLGRRITNSFNFLCLTHSDNIPLPSPLFVSSRFLPPLNCSLVFIVCRWSILLHGTSDWGRTTFTLNRNDWQGEESHKEAAVWASTGGSCAKGPKGLSDQIVGESKGRDGSSMRGIERREEDFLFWYSLMTEKMEKKGTIFRYLRR